MPDMQSVTRDLPSATPVATSSGPRASLTLGHVLTGVGADHDPAVPLEDIHVIRHTFKPSDPDALLGPRI